MCSLQEHIEREIRERQQNNPCDTGTPENPCKGCPDCMGIPAPRHCLEKGMWDEQCVLNAEHAGPHK